MTNKHKGFTAILVDPHRQTVEPVSYSGDWHEIYRLIDAETFDVARINDDGEGFFVDDNGNFRDGQAYFHCQGYLHPIAGKALLMGVDRRGDSVAPKITVEELRKRVRWLMPWEAEMLRGIIHRAMREQAEAAGHTVTDLGDGGLFISLNDKPKKGA
jgi:hypothetical protein